MRSLLPSKTAEATCFMRAAERQGDGTRLVDDPFAGWFLGPLFRGMLATLQAGGRLGIRTEQYSPALITFVLVRHRAIDDALRAALEAGAEQVIVLGAGYDTRGYRFAEQLGDRAVFEVDHPSTQGRKLKVLARRSDELPASRVVHVAVDFETQSLRQRLEEAGLRVGARTFVAWEGVSMYLTREATRATLSVLAELCGPGSELAMDFWFLVDTKDARSALLRMSPHLLQVLGEPVTFGIHPEDVGGFLARAGWEAVDVARPEDLEARYLTDGRRMYPSTYCVRMRR